MSAESSAEVHVGVADVFILAVKVPPARVGTVVVTHLDDGRKHRNNDERSESDPTRRRGGGRLLR